MAYIDYCNTLVGIVPKLPFLYAKTIVNQAWRSIRDSRLWTFNMAETMITIPAIITAGTFSITQYSNSITADATAKAALSGLANPIITLRQWRVSSGGIIYNIINYDQTTGVMTLDRFIQEATNATSGYQLYQCYYPTPTLATGQTLTSDFLRWIAVENPINSYWLDPYYTQDEINHRDPQRSSQGLAYYLAAYKVISNIPYFELWPHPTNQCALRAMYQKRGVDMSANSDDIPVEISSECLLNRAKMLAFEWAIVNASQFPELRGVDWRFAMATAEKSFMAELLLLKKQDDEKMPMDIVFPNRKPSTWGPVDSNFMQNHDVGQ